MPFEAYGPAQGLSHTSVLSAWQDRDGFMWFGTEDGLNRFDGAGFAVHRHRPDDSTSISENWVTAIAEDEAGRLWIGTRHRGINRYDPLLETFERYPYPEFGEEASEPSGVTSALLYTDSTLWIGSGENGLWRFDLDTGRKTRYRVVPEPYREIEREHVWCLYRDRTGYIWAGTWSQGLLRVDPETGTTTYFGTAVDDPGAPRSRQLRSDRIRAIAEDHEGYLWIGTSGGGVKRFDPRTGTFKHFEHDPADPRSLSHGVVWSLLVDRRGTVWAGTQGGGLNRFDRATESFTRFRHDPKDPSSLISNTILRIYEDRSGLLWFGTDNGIATLNPVGEQVMHFRHDPNDPHSLSHSNVLSVAESRRFPGMIWVGTNRGGLNLLDLAQGRTVPLPLPASTRQALSTTVIWDIEEAADGTVWIGTMGDGVFALEPGAGTVAHYRSTPADTASRVDDDVMALHLGRDGDLWIGTNAGGLVRRRPGDGRVTRYRPVPGDETSLGGYGVSVIYEDADGFIWTGSGEGGLSRLDPATGTFTRFVYEAGDSTSLSHNRVYDIHQDPAGTLWVATYGGLNRFEPARERFTRFTVHHGLASDVVLGLSEGGDGYLWISTNRGLTRMDREAGTFGNYSMADGLPTVRFSRKALAHTRNGEIAVGGPNGLLVFPASALHYHHYRPPLVLTALRKFGVRAVADLRGEVPVRLSHRDSYFSLDFALLDYTSPEAHTFRYKLEGFDSEWQKVEGPTGTAHYTNLYGRAGTFLFSVRGVDSKGRANERRVLVTIVPPWWRTPWFRALCLLGSITLAGGALGYRYRRRQQELREKGRMLTEGREQERHLLARELHDVPLQNLYSIRHRLEVFARHAALNGLDAELGETRSILEQTAEDLRRICGDLRPPTLGPFGLSKAIRADLRTFEAAHPEVDVEFELVPDGQQLPEPTRLALFRIYQSALANVVRHAGARCVWVRFELVQHEAVLEIRDDGKGFDVPKSWLELARGRHYGLLGISEWAEGVGGVLSVRSAPGKGTQILVRVPLEAKSWRARAASVIDRIAGVFRPGGPPDASGKRRRPPKLGIRVGRPRRSKHAITRD